MNDALPSVVKQGEDPKGKFHAIRNSWRVTERVVAGTHLAHGEIFSIPPLSLRKGDFVDVSVCVSVAILRGTTGRRFEVSFEPRVVVRLANPQKWTVSSFLCHVRTTTLTLLTLQKVITPPRLQEARAAATQRRPVRKPMALGFKFSGDTEGTAEMEERMED